MREKLDALIEVGWGRAGFLRFSSLAIGNATDLFCRSSYLSSPARAESRGLFEKGELSRNSLLASRTRKRVSCVSQQLITWRNLT